MVGSWWKIDNIQDISYLILCVLNTQHIQNKNFKRSFGTGIYRNYADDAITLNGGGVGMKNIIVITDSAVVADMEFKALRQKLMDKDLLIKAISSKWQLYTKQIAIFFWSTNSPFYPASLDTIAYADCKIGKIGYKPIMSRIFEWRRIEKLIENMPPDTEEIQYSDIENLKILEMKE